MGCIKVNIQIKKKPIQVQFTINHVMSSNGVQLIYGNASPRLN